MRKNSSWRIVIRIKNIYGRRPFFYAVNAPVWPGSRWLYNSRKTKTNGVIDHYDLFNSLTANPLAVFYRGVVLRTKPEQKGRIL